MTEDNKELFEEQSLPQEESQVSDSIKKEDFVLVQQDAHIHDKKFETKPTTFIKDAFKRFCKNKSSVVGAIILGILILLAIIVPVVSTKDIKNNRVPESFLAPKLFKAGTGFWDGTVKHEHIIYDIVEEKPSGFKKNAVLNLEIDAEPTLIDQGSLYGHYGTLMFENENINIEKDELLYSKEVEWDLSKDYTLTIVLDDEAGVQNKSLGEYRISIAVPKATLVKVEGNKVYWKRAAENDSSWRELVVPMIETKEFVKGVDEKIQFRYVGSTTWIGIDDYDVEALLEGVPEDATLIVYYNQTENKVQYRYSNETADPETGEYLYTGDFSPKLQSIQVQVNEEDATIEWQNSELHTWSPLELLANLDDGSGDKFSNVAILKDFSTEYGTYTFKLSDYLTDTTNGYLCFTLKSQPQPGVRSYILIESISLTSNVDDEETALAKSLVSFDDATQMVLRGIDHDSYWYCTGRKGVHNSQIYYCSFSYDTYADVFDPYDDVVAKSQLDEYVANGWMTYEYDKVTKKITSYEILSSECPVEELYLETTRAMKTGSLMDVEGKMRMYAKYGYKKMPIFLFGTNAQGNDLFKKAFSGLRTSLILGVCTAAFCFIFGLVWGSISGYFGGNIDIIMERFCEILSGVPWIVIMTLCILKLGNNFFTFFLALCMTGWMGTAARTRTQFYRFKGREYVLASRTLGSSDMRLIFRHILPNSMGTIITSSVLMIPSVIFSESTLAYLNLGLQGVESFGVMIAENQKYLSLYPNLVVFPAIIIALMMISFNLFGNGLRDALNPSLKGSE